MTVPHFFVTETAHQLCISHASRLFFWQSSVSLWACPWEMTIFVSCVSWLKVPLFWPSVKLFAPNFFVTCYSWCRSAYCLSHQCPWFRSSACLCGLSLWHHTVANVAGTLLCRHLCTLTRARHMNQFFERRKNKNNACYVGFSFCYSFLW